MDIPIQEKGPPSTGIYVSIPPVRRTRYDCLEGCDINLIWSVPDPWMSNSNPGLPAGFGYLVELWYNNGPKSSQDVGRSTQRGWWVTPSTNWTARGDNLNDSSQVK